MRNFEEKEYYDRISKARTFMDKNNIGFLLITSPHNFRYFSGLNTYFWESPTRPWFLLIPLEKNPIAIIPSIGETAVKKTFIKEIITWNSPNPKDEGISQLVETILSINSKKTKIGCELGYESHLRMSINDFDKLKLKLSEFEFVDGSKIIWKLRIIKSNNEIKKIRKIVSIASKAFDELPNSLQIGQTEIEICNIMKKKLIDLGADHTLYMSCASGSHGYDQIICDPSDKKINYGDVLVIDTGSTYDGYFCDFNRNFVFGEIDKDTQNAQDLLWEATQYTLEKIKPGVTCAQINEYLNSKLISKDKSLNNIGRMGHGFGLQLTEPPSIMLSDNTVMKENMIIALEPAYTYKNKILVHEENILITSNSCERLSSRTPKQIPLIK